MRFAEFFAGIGLVRLGLEQSGWTCTFANDIDPRKAEVYQRNFVSKDFFTENIANISAHHLPSVELATASFPCQDLSLAGKRQGLSGDRSGTFREFIRILWELKQQNRLPRAVMLENVVGLLTSHQGRDIREILQTLSSLGYALDVLVLNAVHFVPQSRPRVFIIGMNMGKSSSTPELFAASSLTHEFRNREVAKLFYLNSDLTWHFLDLPPPPQRTDLTLQDIVQAEGNWFEGGKLTKELSYIRDNSRKKLERALLLATETQKPYYLAGYRRMRKGLVSLELRDDGVAGCLRAVTGGSSKQLLVKAGPDGKVDIRYMTAREYARLQGVPDIFWIPDKQVVGLHAFGDAVAVPVIAWLGKVLLNTLRAEKSQEACLTP